MNKFTCYIAGRPAGSGPELTVRCPYDQRGVGTVALCGRADTEAAITAALARHTPLSRHERSSILENARTKLEERRDEFARLISGETGLALREARYEVGRTLDVLRFSAMEA